MVLDLLDFTFIVMQNDMVAIAFKVWNELF